MLERKVRSRAQQLFELRGQNQGHDLQDWFQAEAEVLENPSFAPLYRRWQGQETADEQDAKAGEESTLAEHV